MAVSINKPKKHKITMSPELTAKLAAHNAAKRWTADIYRSSDKGLEVLEVVFDEFEHLGDVVEQGPHWDTVVEIVVKRNPNDTLYKPLTVEEAAKL